MKTLHTSGKVRIRLTRSKDLLKLSGPEHEAISRLLKTNNIKATTLADLTKNQLSEIYGLSDSLIEEIKPKLMLDSLKLNKININDASKKELATHPYISWNLANAILNYKVQHGDYDSLSKIKQIHLVNDDLHRKIVPYISLD